MRIFLASAVAIGLAACSRPSPPLVAPVNAPYVLVLGTAQDGGYPQAGCESRCARGWSEAGARRFVASLAVVDPESGERWLIDATPDFRDQLHLLERFAPASRAGLTGIFLTHAHIGHYTGLMHLGREVMGASRIPVYAMPRMDEFLRSNGPWDQLVRLENIVVVRMEDGLAVRLSERITITPFLVPHRDEYSETVGYRIRGPGRSVVFIPDIDKWERWAMPVERIVRENDVALLDGTFFAEGELPGRSMAEIPHPFIQESLARFAALPPEERAKVRFIHLNQSNPALDPAGDARRSIVRAGCRVAEQGDVIPL
jgi:pyrroloquinoline quinone biosynthesis protein B